jgi:ABC-type ATPase involved in cell division
MMKECAISTISGFKEWAHYLPTQRRGGQQQVAIPRLFLADEPTGVLATVNSCEIMDISKVIYTTGMTAIVVTYENNIFQKT